MTFSNRFFAIGAVLLCLVALPSCYAQNDASAQSSAAQPQMSEAGLKLVPLTIQSGDKEHKFLVEIAQSQPEQAKGMMFRTELAPDKGMVFPFAKDRIASFWMKNCVISLDMVFVHRDGTIESIAPDRVPYSLDSTSSGAPVAAVLELVGGRTAELGIAPGDKVTW